MLFPALSKVSTKHAPYMTSFRKYKVALTESQGNVCTTVVLQADTNLIDVKAPTVTGIVSKLERMLIWFR